jgi:hypothetical protein
LCEGKVIRHHVGLNLGHGSSHSGGKISGVRIETVTDFMSGGISLLGTADDVYAALSTTPCIMSVQKVLQF